MDFPEIRIQNGGHSLVIPVPVLTVRCHKCCQMHTEARKTITTDCLNRCDTRGVGLLLQTVSGDATRINHTAHKSKQPSMQWHLKTLPWKTFKGVPLLGPIIPTVCCDKTAVFVHWLPQETTVELWMLRSPNPCLFEVFPTRKIS
jgi:hypothetical protein